MKIEFAYQEGLKKLIKEKPLDEINVVMLCEECNSNRQTFYYHFRDISDVVESIFLKAKVGYAKKLLDYEPILKEMINYINTNYNFVSAINKVIHKKNYIHLCSRIFIQESEPFLKTTMLMVWKSRDICQLYRLTN